MAESAPTTQTRGSVRRAGYLTATLGLLHAALLVLSLVILREAPGIHSSDAELVAFYDGNARRSVLAVGLYLMPFAAIAFIWFIIALRMWVASHDQPEQPLFSNVQLVAGILFVALFLVAAAAFSVAASGVEFAEVTVDPTSVRLFPQLGQVVVVVLAMRLAAIFVLTTSAICRRAGVLPAWFIMVGYPVGLILLLAASLNTLLVIIFPVWVTGCCVVIITRLRTIPVRETAPSDTVPTPSHGARLPPPTHRTD